MSIRSDTRYAELVRKVGFPSSQNGRACLVKDGCSQPRLMHSKPQQDLFGPTKGKCKTLPDDRYPILALELQLIGKWIREFSRKNWIVVTASGFLD